MEQWQCLACPYIYDPKTGDPGNDIPAGTKFEDLSDNWTCPVCGSPKAKFRKLA